MMKYVRKILAIFFLFSILLEAPSCSFFKPSANKKAQKMQKKQEKIEIKKYNKAKKEHYKHQSESTQRLMKNAKKQQYRINKIHRRSFWDQWFHRKCNKRPY